MSAVGLEGGCKYEGQLLELGVHIRFCNCVKKAGIKKEGKLLKLNDFSGCRQKSYRVLIVLSVREDI